MAAINAARSRLELTDVELWLAYFGVGGNLAPAALLDYLDGNQTGLGHVGVAEHNYVIDAINDVMALRQLDTQLGYGIR